MPVAEGMLMIGTAVMHFLNAMLSNFLMHRRLQDLHPFLPSHAAHAKKQQHSVCCHTSSVPPHRVESRQEAVEEVCLPVQPKVCVGSAFEVRGGSEAQCSSSARKMGGHGKCQTAFQH